MRGRWSRGESWRKLGMCMVRLACTAVGVMQMGEWTVHRSDGVLKSGLKPPTRDGHSSVFPLCQHLRRVPLLWLTLETKSPLNQRVRSKGRDQTRNAIRNCINNFKAIVQDFIPREALHRTMPSRRALMKSPFSCQKSAHNQVLIWLEN